MNRATRRVPPGGKVQLTLPAETVLRAGSGAGALDFVPLPIVTLNEDGAIYDCNTAAAQLFGRQREHLMRLPFAVLVRPESVAVFLNHVQRCRDFRSEVVTTEVQVRLPGHKTAPMQLVTRAMPGTGGMLLQTALVDLSEHNERERELEKARQYTELFEFVPGPLLVLDLDLYILASNSALRDKLQCSRAQVEGNNLEQLDVVRWKTRKLFDELRHVASSGASLQNFPCEATLVGFGRPLHLLVSARRPAHIPGKLPVVLVALQDITEQRAHERERETLVAKLQELNDQLEQRVAERTDDLHEANESLRAMTRRVVEAQENERQAVARELHDEVGQALTGLTLLLTRAARENEGESLKKARQVVGDLLERVRNLSVHLRPHVLDNLGLLPALRWHVKNYTQQTGLRIVLRIDGCEGLNIPPDAALTIFRVTQEVLTNVSRHANAQSVQIHLRGSTSELELSVEDNGRGFDVQSVKPESAGLRNMRERVELTEGKFSIESEPGRGTNLCVKLPLGGE